MKNKALVTQYADQFKPYSGSENFLVTDWSKPFSGTLFRLPLRTPEQAETSMLSKRALSTVDAVQLLDALQVEASAMLLFLKNVEAIEIREYLQDETSSRLRFAANIKNIDKPLRQKRAFISDFRSHLPKLQSNPSHSTSADYTLAIECVNSIEKEQKIYAHQPIIYTESWVICNQLGGLSANKIAMDKDNALLRLIPWGGVAACIDCTDSSIGENSSRDGLAYCFLPLPVKTALPVMTNGFFELSSNRRDIWQGGADQTGDGRTRALWNVSLMKDVIAPSYIRLLLQLKTIIGFTETYQKMWPSIRTASPWKDLVESVLSLSQSQLLLQVNGFENSTSANAKSPIWVKCSEAILLPKVYQKYQLDPVDQSQLLNFLKMCSAPVVVCIPTLRDTLEESKTCPIVAFPSLVRQLLRSHNTSLILQKLHCRFLMKYCILDLHSDDVQSFTELNLLKVVPLTNNDVAAIAVYNQREVSAINELISMGFNATDALAALSASKFDVGTACDLITSDQFSKVKTNAKILILAGEEELNVFTSNSSTMIDRDALDPLSIEFLSSASLQRMSNVRNFQASLVVDLIKQLLPPAAINGSNYFDSSKLSGEEKILFDRFINSFWNYSRTKPDVVSAIVLGPPLVPIANDSSCYSLSRVSNLIGSTKGDTVLPQDLLEVMVTIGAHVVNSSLLQNAIAMPSVFWENVHSPSRSGVISAVEYALRSNKNITGNLTDDQKDNLRKYLVISEPIKRISGKQY